MKAEEYAIVLDYLPKGKPGATKIEPIAQVIGVDYFTLLEVVPKQGVDLKLGDKVYVGKDQRDKIDHIKNRISFKDLTVNAVAELEKTIENIVTENEKKYVEFFNKSLPITIRMHQLELLPGLGKKHLFQILDEREKKPFESFDEIYKRIPLMPNPKKLIVKRVIEELRGEDDPRHYIFVKPIFERETFNRRGKEFKHKNLEKKF